MIFNPQSYKIIDQKGVPFIDIDEIDSFLEVSPSEREVREVIECALAKKRLSMAQTALLLRSDKAMRGEIMKAASRLKQEVYGNRIVLFAPLYVGNLCSNLCNYCSFAADNTLTSRKTLTTQELNQEVDTLSGQGHKRLILVYGEHPKYSAHYIAQSVKEVYLSGKIRRVNINAAPLGVEGFRVVAESGIGTYQIFQESYNPEVYKRHHLGGMKSDYNWRLTSLDRAMEAGIDDVGLGVLFGLNSSWEQEIMALIRHTNHLEACFGVGPHTISFPRITQAVGATPAESPISDENFIFAIAVLRLAIPYAGLILTARESAELRDRAIEYGVSQIDGGTVIEVGGYSEENQWQGAAQFSITDDRSLHEIITELVKQERIPSFCTACYRKGRTGEHFMEFSVDGHIKELCSPNAILSFAEYLEDCPDSITKSQGYALIEREIAKLSHPEPTIRQLNRIKQGERDLFF